MPHAVSDRSSCVPDRWFSFITTAKSASVPALARRIVFGAATLVAVACSADAPTEPTTLVTPSGPQLTLTGGTGTLIFPIVNPGDFQPFGTAIGLNNSGQVTGSGRLTQLDDQNKPYRWTPGQTAVKLNGCCDTQFGVDINDAGVVVGSEQVDIVTGWRGFVATGTTMVRLPILAGAPPDGDAHAFAVNDAGEIVGVSVAADRNGHAVLWSPAGVIRDLGTLLGGRRSAAFDINDAGQVIGMSEFGASFERHPFLWSSGTGMQDLNILLGADILEVVEINDAGQIVGTYVAPSGQSHAFRYTPGVGLHDLGTLGGNSSVPTGLNGKGDVVGMSAIGDGTMHAFLWTEADGIEDITAITGIQEVRRLNDNLQTLTGTAPPTAIVVASTNASPRLVQLAVTQSNSPPIAVFTAECNGLTCTLDATGSTDDRPGLTYAWDLNKYPDGFASGAVVTVTYPHAGQRTPTLTVTDANGASSSVSQTFTITDNQPPVADFTWSCSGTVCTLDGSASNDDKGIVSYAWSLGKAPDGTATGVMVTTDYWHASTRTVTLTVTDADGASNSITKTFEVGVATDAAPTARFTWSCIGTVCTFDASTSTDDVGITSYDWSLGKLPDNSASGVTVTTDYWHSSTRFVTLTVTDTKGQTNTVTQTVTVP